MRTLNPLSIRTWPFSGRSLFSDIAANAFDEADWMADNLLQPDFASTTNFQPNCDINETNDHYLISFDMPGVKKEDIEIETQGNQLNVYGERQRETKEMSEDKVLRHERSYGKYSRSFILPTSIDSNKIEAHYEDGVLNIALPKTETAKGRKVQIQSGKSGFLDRLLGSKKDDAKELKDVKVS